MPELQTKSLLKFATSLIIPLCVTLSSLPSFAALGGDVSSVRNDQAHINASLRTTQMSAYSLHELRATSGTVVREFASPSGRVFAVSWQGPSHPDLRQLLGPFFENFRQALKAQNRRPVGGPVFVQQDGLVVEIAGHMRSIRGRAYLLDQLPAGVRTEDLH